MTSKAAGNISFTSFNIKSCMMNHASHHPSPELIALEANANAARNIWACMFASSDEYERALIQARRAEGRYAKTRDWTVPTAIACGLAFVASIILLAS